MELPAIFSATLGLSPPWRITSVAIASDESRLDITVAYEATGNSKCPCCGATGETCLAEEANETWYHRDFFRYATYLHARTPQIRCHCGVHPVERPWSRSGSKFVRIP